MIVHQPAEASLTAIAERNSFAMTLHKGIKKVFGSMILLLIGLTVTIAAGYAQIPAIGFKFDSRNVANSPTAGTLVGIEFTGECPGRLEPTASARFFSTKTRPAPELRAIVKNVTFGFAGEQRPFTDREYFSGDVSERFQIRYGDRHAGKYLAVQPGENQFEYEIKRGPQLIETGKFAIAFNNKIETRYRSTVPVRRESKYCDKYNKHGKCIRERVEVYYAQECP